MEIIGLETILLSDNWRAVDPYWRGGPINSTALVRVHTDSGITGLGESLLGYFAPETVTEIVRFYEPLLVGRDPMDTATLWRDMYKSSFFWGRGGAALSVISAIDIALWDLKARALDMPLWRLLGGLARKSILAYASGGSSLWPFEQTVEKLSRYRDLGFRAAKFGVSSTRRRVYDPLWGMSVPNVPGSVIAEEERDKLKMIRDALGTDFLLMGQCSGLVPYSANEAVLIANALADFGVYFFEEPVICEDLAGYVHVRDHSLVPIAGGEALAGLTEFRRFIEAGALDVVQPDVTHCGGITVALQVAILARSHRVKIAFHLGGSFGPGYAAALHLSLVLPECVILETVPATENVRRLICQFPVDLVDGCVLPPACNGLGVELSDDTIAALPFVPGSGERT